MEIALKNKSLIGEFITSITFMFLLSPVGYAQQQWKMQALQMQSKWSKEVDIEHPHNVYPRPQMIRSDWYNLNGLWDYTITKFSSPLPTNYSGKVLVPYPIESALSGVKKSLLPDEILWYRQSFNMSKIKFNKRLLIHFGAVDYKATVYINNKEVGSHEGGYTNFSFDITNYIMEGENEIIVKVLDPTDAGVGPHGKQVLRPENIYYTATSGIWQSVWMEFIPEISISSLKIKPDVDNSKLYLQVNLMGKANDYSLEAIAKASGKLVCKHSSGTSRITTNKDTSYSSSFSLPIKNMHLWSPNDPYLYDLKIRLLYKGELVDEVESYFGMRKVEIKKDSSGIDRIFLNNTYTFNLGTLDQGYWPEGLYTAPTDEALAYDIKIIKEMGFNTIRKHIKVEPARWYYYADYYGILVWQDFVNPNQGLPPGAKQAFEKQTKETIDQLFNYPCITTWVLFNERWGAYDQQRLTEWIKKNDSTRLINGHSGEMLYVNEQLRQPSENPYASSDMADVHSYPNPMNAPYLPNKARVLGEFGGIGVPVPGHQWDDLTGWGYIQATPKELLSKYEHFIKLLGTLEKKGLTASIYTQPFDVEGEENGLLTYDRSIIKIPIKRLRQLHATLTNLDTSSIDISKLVLPKTLDINDTDERFPHLLQEFKSGRQDSCFLRRLVLMALRLKDQENATLVGNQYLNSLTNVFLKDNLNFIQHITSTSRDSGFKMFSTDSIKISKIIGRASVISTLKKVIISEEISPFLNNLSDSTREIINHNIQQKYSEFGRQLLNEELLGHYWNVKDWDNFSKYYVIYFGESKHKSKYNINNASWQLFQHCNDHRVLHFAAEIAKYNIERFDKSPNSLDTYANILYKIGKSQEALKWQEKAVVASNNNKKILNNYNKMKKGEPTWSK
ncbi:glycoside hydrolase family 2 protein [Olivibacter domesticus]|uniref:Beta-galactosidase/beta-glucuronidase n=1 Tax=Olivibacter domesticus TaxID=407022 RepID=A0A1H7IGV2_OLID1|nr:sugar-binding domain-containing protein [Olivibacter domesticus]SEK61554.1 Beta-galactosidase/beta-glucuronidase [Olivibacter domesticus]